MPPSFHGGVNGSPLFPSPPLESQAIYGLSTWSFSSGSGGGDGGSEGVGWGESAEILPAKTRKVRHPEAFCLSTFLFSDNQLQATSSPPRTYTDLTHSWYCFAWLHASARHTPCQVKKTDMNERRRWVDLQVTTSVSITTYHTGCRKRLMAAYNTVFFSPSPPVSSPSSL